MTTGAGLAIGITAGSTIIMTGIAVIKFLLSSATKNDPAKNHVLNGFVPRREIESRLQNIEDRIDEVRSMLIDYVFKGKQ